MSHLGRPSCKRRKIFFKVNYIYLQKLLGDYVVFSNDCIGSSVEKLNDLNNGEVMVLENLRFYKEEKIGEKKFSEKLSRLVK